MKLLPEPAKSEGILVASEGNIGSLLRLKRVDDG